ncbi:hypothetical protein F4561_003475 [Lipingzhangella halophila]|uniref:Uncharacterized protein n=1 Tax=Lipingzhangella halophila TaxID=1783352 RepID=A0A7W7W4E4_9ACTN|nr:hypothetical protein [Lipingzhangella halophila]
MTSVRTAAAGLTRRAMSVPLAKHPRAQPNGQGHWSAPRSHASFRPYRVGSARAAQRGLDHTCRQPGSRPGRRGAHHPNNATASTHVRTTMCANTAGPAPREVRFLPRPRAGASSEEIA